MNRKEQIVKKLAESIALDRQNMQHFIQTIENIKAMKKDILVMETFKKKLETQLKTGKITVKTNEGKTPSLDDVKVQVTFQENKLNAAQGKLNFEMDNFKWFMRDKGSVESYAKKVKEHFDKVANWAKAEGIL